MYDDTSAISTSGCVVLANDTTIYTYSGNNRKTYVKMGGKWYYTRNESYSYMPDYSSYQCLTDISHFKSAAAFEPIYYLISFILFLTAVGLFFYVLKRAFYAFKVN